MSRDITALLHAHAAGEAEAMSELLPQVYDALRAIARRQIRRSGAGETLNTTSLVHEAYLKLVDSERSSYLDRAHFFAVAATAMRHILIDYARERRAEKRGGGRHHVDLDRLDPGAEEQLDLLLAVNQGLERLAELSKRLAQVAECRFFAGLSEQETADALGVSRRTVQRDWIKARALLKRDLATS